METLLKELRVLFPAEKFVVTGSVALAKYGLFDITKVGDVDIILVKPTKEAAELALRMEKEYPPLKKLSGGVRIASFIKDGKHIELYSSLGAERSLCIDGIEYSLIKDIVTAKKKYNRVKDWLQLRTISRIFFKEEEFKTFLDK